MITKEQILKILKKYGFDSLHKEPFLYENKNQIGIFYTVKDSLYGYLNRIYLPKTLEEAEEFIKKYYEAKKNKYQIVFSNYITNTPKPEFIEIKKEEKKKEEIIKKTYQPRELRTALLLLDIILDKLTVQKTTYDNVRTIHFKYQQTKKRWQELYNKVLKQKTEYFQEPFSEEINNNLEDIIKPYKDQLEQINTSEEIKEYIKILITNLKELEKQESLIKNKYLLIKIPIEINVLENQIKILEEILKKKKIFIKKNEINNILKEIENESEINKIVSYPSFKNNEQNRIDEKYEMINEMDISTIADYIIEFDNLTIKEPLIKTKEEIKEETKTFEQTMKLLEDDFNKRTEEEKNIIYILTSFMHNLLDFKDNLALLKEESKEYLKIINNPNNILAKIKIFKNIHTNNYQNLEKDLEQLKKSLINLKPTIIPSDLNLFFKEQEALNSDYIIGSTKKSCMPISNSSKDLITYVVTIKKDSKVYFTPQKLDIDIQNEDLLYFKNNCPIFIVDLEKNSLKSENSDIIKISRYEIEKQTIDDVVVINKLKIDKVDNYKKIYIERKEEKNE